MCHAKLVQFFGFTLRLRIRVGRGQCVDTANVMNADSRHQSEYDRKPVSDFASIRFRETSFPLIAELFLRKN